MISENTSIQGRFNTPYSAIILAAGKGIRMGKPKWQLKMQSGQYFFSFLCLKYLELGCETVLVVNRDDLDFFEKNNDLRNIKISVNNNPDLGRFYSVKCGLDKLKSHNNTFIHNVDNPFLNKKLFDDMKAGLKNFDYVIPMADGKGGHPLLISYKIAGMIAEYKKPYPNLRSILDNFNGNRIKYENTDILLNINTPEDYQSFIMNYRQNNI